MVKCCSMRQASLAVGEVHFLGQWHWLSERFYVKVFSITSPFLIPSPVSAEHRQSSAEGMPLLGGRPARISDGLFRSLWGVSSGGILHPLARLRVPHQGGHEAIAAFLGLNLRPTSEKPLWTTSSSPDPLGQPLPADRVLFSAKTSSAS